MLVQFLNWKLRSFSHLDRMAQDAAADVLTHAPTRENATMHAADACFLADALFMHISALHIQIYQVQ